MSLITKTDRILARDRDKFKPFVELVGVALLAIYTAYTIKMYRANKQAAECGHGNRSCGGFVKGVNHGDHVI
jgi:hypothetical protein